MRPEGHAGRGEAAAPPNDEEDSDRDREPESLPFDQYQRYRLVADLVRSVARPGERLRVLDLGGRTGVLRRFLPQHDVVLVDVEASQEPGLVLGDGSALPFADRAFDVLVACDTLEHVPVAGRAAFVAETARVARRYVVLAGPYRTERVAEAEQRLREFLRSKLGLAHRYLDEHATHGLPDLDATAGAFERLGARTARVGHGNLDRWLALLCLSMYMDEDRHLRAIARRMYRFYNRALYPSDTAPPVYRHALVAALAGAPLPALSSLFSPPVALPMSLEPFAGLVAELAAFDREQDVYRRERERLEGIVAGLARDLEGHRRAKADLEVDLAGHRESLAEARERIERQDDEIERLGASLDSERARSQRLEHEVASQRLIGEDVARDLEGHRRAAAALERDLAGHRALLEEVRRDLAGHAGLARELERELHAARSHAAAVEQELARVRAEARAIEAEAIRANEAASATNERLVASRAEVVALRDEIERMLAELRSRRANLSRALKPRRPLY